MWKRIAIVLVGCSVLSVPALAQRAPATKPAKKEPVKKEASPEQQALNEAIKALQAEGQAYQKSGDLQRKKCDYFSSGVSPIPQDAILRALSRQLANNTLVDTYIKWQLLSGVVTFEPRYDADIAQLINNAPGLIPLRGSTEDEYRDLTNAVRKVRADEIDQYRNDFEKARKDNETMNTVLSEYRLGLIARAPVSSATLEARFNDVIMRFETGAQFGPQLDKAQAAVKLWSQDARPQDIKLFRRVVDNISRKQLQPAVTGISWDDKTHKAVWNRTSGKLDLKDLSAFLGARQ